MCLSLYYVIDNDEIKIISLWGLKKVAIPTKEISGYQVSTGNIRGIRLSGYGGNNFAIGRTMIDKIGATYMYVTSSKNTIYLKTDEISYGVSPEDMDAFISSLKINGIHESSWELRLKKNVSLLKDKKFTVPFVISTLIIAFITINPIVQYLYNNIPVIMPLSFDAKFTAVSYGTGKQFAFHQMTLGLLNMAVLFCMYYASYFISKYDKKSIYKYIFVPLALSVIFLIMQVRIFLTFR